MLIRALALALCLAAPAAAQSLFAPVARVGDAVVTAYELDQRIRFNRALGSDGDLRPISLDQLVEDRLRLAAAERNGIRPTEEEVTEGMEEFAARADLDIDGFLAAIAEDGVEPPTFREFVRAGLAYRQVVQARFGPVVDVSDADVERALERVEPTGSLQVSLAEIILPADTPEREAQARGIAQELRGIASFAEFEAAARQVSFAATREQGGRLDPVPAERLPGPIRERVLALPVGGVSEPIPIPDALLIFQFRGAREVVGEPDPVEAIDYAAFYIPGGRTPQALAEAAAIDARVDGCDDLYGVARGLPPERLERGVRPVGTIPADVATQLALLDEGEVSVALTRAGGRSLVFLMLCERDPLPEPDGSILADPEEDGEEAGPTAPSPERVRTRLRNERLAAYADAYLDELRADLGVEILAP
jgi:peptidyl-prolyl cis-trans isomerase SurA